jgi:hypothetical protein
MIYVGNSFSLNMLEQFPAKLAIEEVDLEQVKQMLSTKEFMSAVGHQATAEILSKILGLPVIFNRQSIKLTEHDTLVVFQLMTRLPEGAVLGEEELKTLPHKFILVKIEK